MVEEHQVEEQQKKCAEKISRDNSAPEQTACATLRSGRDVHWTVPGDDSTELRGWALSECFSTAEIIIAARKSHHARVVRCTIPFVFPLPVETNGTGISAEIAFSIRHSVVIVATTWRPPSGSGFETRKQAGFVIGDDVGRTEAPPQILIHARRKALASQRVNCRRRRRIAID